MNEATPNPAPGVVESMLVSGKSGSIELLSLSRDVSVVDDLCTGVFYRATVARQGGGKVSAVGMNPKQAVARAVLRTFQEENPAMN